MADGKQVQYYGMDKPLLPYKSYTSPVDESPHFCLGSQNILGSQIGFLQKRPGFSDSLESSLSVIPGKIVRIFTWKRWVGSITNSGSFFVMVCAVTNTTSTVWKYRVGGDASFSLVWTDANSANPFDFQDSNNFVFFGNASTRVNMRKYDGVDCTLWGVDAPPAAPSFALTGGVLPAGLVFDETTGILSGTPTIEGTSALSVTATDASGTAATQNLSISIAPAGLQWKTPAGALPPAKGGIAYSTTLLAQSGTLPYTFTLFSGTLPTGLTLSTTGVLSGTTAVLGNVPFAVKVTDAALNEAIRSFSLYVGSAAIAVTPTTLPDAVAGTLYSQQLTASGGTGPYTYAVVGGTIPNGLTLASTGVSAGLLSGTPTTAGQFSLTVRITDSTGTPLTAQFFFPLNIAATALTVTTTSLPAAQVGVPYSTTITVSGGTAPYSFTYNAGALSAQTGYVMGYTYTSRYGHESAMSELSDNTGLFTDQDIGVDLIASSDPQVNGINYYRSTDGGDQDPAVMRLVSSLDNVTQSYRDSTQDIFLGNQTGPGFFLNDPPQPLRGFVWSNGRIWGFKEQAQWFTGNEEITNGVPVECMSDAKNGNYYQWSSEIGGLAVTSNGVDAGLSEEFWQVSGDTLDTFRKSRLLKGGGTQSPTCITSVGDTVYWIDTAKQFMSSDKGEIGEAIRTDLALIDLQQTFLTYYKFGTRNFLCILDALNGKLFIFDMDLDQWQTPWTVNATALMAGQTENGKISLIAAFPSGHVRTLSLNGYNDDGVLYSDQMRSNLFPIVPGGKTPSRNTNILRQLEQVEVETNAVTSVLPSGATVVVPLTPDEMYVLTDDDPIARDLETWLQVYPEPFQFGDSQAAQYLLARRWKTNQLEMGRRVAFCGVWEASETPWAVYTLDICWRVS